MSPNFKARKLERKQRRCEALIHSDFGIERSSAPTQILAILNAGLCTGLSEEATLCAAMPHGVVLQVLMLPNKSYCFLECESSADAERIYNALHGVAKIGQQDSVVYLSYFTSLPTCNEQDIWAKDLPHGLTLLPDIVDEAEEQALLQAVGIDVTVSAVAAGNNDDLDVKETGLKHRRVKHFGYEFLYGINNVDPTQPLPQKIPEICNIIWPRLKALSEEYGLPSFNWDLPDQLTVNVYEPGQGIPPHVDTHSAFLEPIVSLSLLGETVMDFRRGDERVPLILLRRSLLVMFGETRYDWTHGITPRIMDVVLGDVSGLTVEPRKRRVSLTFRRLRRSPCNCAFPTLCDTRLQNSAKTQMTEMSQQVAVQLEELNVHNVYDHIAPHFSETRHTPWPRVADFLRSFAPGAVLLDVGCGNGKYLKCNADALAIGCDRSAGLLKVCIEKTKAATGPNNTDAFRCDCLQVPVRTASIDGCISIAVIHHLATTERRLAAVREIARLLRKDGRALVYVWAKNQQADEKKSSYLRQNKALNKQKTTVEEQRQRTAQELQREEEEQPQRRQIIAGAPQLPVHTNRTDFLQQDVLVPWKLKGVAATETVTPTNTYLRYYHVFEQGELEHLIAAVPEIELLQSYYDQGNHCVIFQRKLGETV